MKWLYKLLGKISSNECLLSLLFLLRAHVSPPAISLLQTVLAQLSLRPAASVPGGHVLPLTLTCQSVCSEHGVYPRLVHIYSTSLNCPQVPSFVLSANVFISVGCSGLPRWCC